MGADDIHRAKAADSTPDISSSHGRLDVGLQHDERTPATDAAADAGGESSSHGRLDVGPQHDERTPATDAAADAGGEKVRPVVIGEQQDRVEYAARRFEADTYPGLPKEEQARYPTGSPELKAAMLEDNKAWINRMKEEGRLVIDTGPAEYRASYPAATRQGDWPKAPYETELTAIENYPNVIRPWEDLREAPNFPWKYDPATYSEDEGFLHHDEGTPASDAATPTHGLPASTDSPESIAVPDSHPVGTHLASVGDEGHTLPASAGPADDQPPKTPEK